MRRTRYRIMRNIRMMTMPTMTRHTITTTITITTIPSGFADSIILRQGLAIILLTTWIIVITIRFILPTVVQASI